MLRYYNNCGCEPTICHALTLSYQSALTKCYQKYTTQGTNPSSNKYTSQDREPICVRLSPHYNFVASIDL